MSIAINGSISCPYAVEDVKCPEVFILMPEETEEEERYRCRCNWTKVFVAGSLSWIGSIIASNPLTLSTSGVVHSVIGGFVSGIANSASSAVKWRSKPHPRIIVLENSMGQVTKYLKAQDLSIQKQADALDKLKRQVERLARKKLHKKAL